MFLINPYILSSSALDADAQAFITTASITDPTQQSAINQLVLDLKSANVWSKLNAVYPFIGGNASSHSYNLINTSNYQLTFNGGWTHSSTGVTPNGTNAYAQTGLVPRGLLGVNDTHISVYSRTNDITGVRTEIGSSSASNTDNLYATYMLAGNNYIGINQFGDSIGAALTSSLGMMLLNRSVSTSISRFYNNVKTTVSSNSTNTSTQQIVLSAFNNGGTIKNYSNKELAFSTIGASLTDTEASDFYTAVQTFQTTLGRQV
jgi:hypothetical protein